MQTQELGRTVAVPKRCLRNGVLFGIGRRCRSTGRLWHSGILTDVCDLLDFDTVGTHFLERAGRTTHGRKEDVSGWLRSLCDPELL